MGKIYKSNRNQNTTDYSFNSTQHLQAQIDAHAHRVKGFLDAGWDVHLFSVTQLPGSRILIKAIVYLSRASNRPCSAFSSISFRSLLEV
jgi:hypothetical protein